MATNLPILNDRRQLERLAASGATFANVGVVMRAAKTRGWRFADGWAVALAMVGDPALADTLTATRGAWVRAYRGQAPAPGERAAGVLTVDAGDDHGRTAGRSFGAFV